MSLAHLQMQAGHINSAVQLLQDATQLEPYYPPPYLALARLYLLTNEKQKAVQTLERILKLQPEDESARKQLEEARSFL